MHLVLMAVVPIVLLLGLGTVLRRRLVTDPGIWRGVEWMSYRVFTPALFVTSIAATDLAAASPAALLPSLAVPVVVVSVLIIALRRPLRANGPQLTSLVQGSIRINAYIGLVFASAAYGPAGVATFALAAAVMVPLVNVISVSVLSKHGDRDDRDRPRLWRELPGNPLIQGCAAGLALNLLQINMPAFLATTLGMLAAPALVCGTLAAGAAITFRLRRRDVVDIRTQARRPAPRGGRHRHSLRHQRRDAHQHRDHLRRPDRTIRLRPRQADGRRHPPHGVHHGRADAALDRHAPDHRRHDYGMNLRAPRDAHARRRRSSHRLPARSTSQSSRSVTGNISNGGCRISR